MTLKGKKDIIYMLIHYVDGGDKVTYEKMGHDESNSTIEWTLIIKCILEKWKSVVASALVCALIGVIYAAVTYVPMYTSSLSYVINVKSTNSDAITDQNFVVAEYLANTYSYVIKSRDFIQRIQAETGLSENVNEYISSSLKENSNIMLVTVKSKDADKSYEIASAISRNLPETAKQTVQSSSLSPIEEPLKAVVPDADSGLMKMGALGAVAGMILAMAAIVILQLLRNTVMTPNTLTGRIDIAHIASVPHVVVNKGKKSKAGRHEPMLITNKKTGFVFSETYKSLRTKIERYAKKNNAKAILVTSALENEGKTTVAANIAISLAQNGNRVIMIDCDLRKPAVAKILEMTDNVVYSTLDVIEKKVEVEKAIVTKSNLNVNIHAICGIKAVGNSSEVLSARGLKNVLDTLREKYDYIIVDTPPSQLFTDAAIISEYTDAAILVVRQNSANVDDVVGVANDVSQSKAELIGFVFNNVSDTSILPGGYSKKYNYSYYGYGGKE